MIKILTFYRMAPGMMITQNNPNVSGWSLENGYTGRMNDTEYPIRVVDSGQNAALDVALVISQRNFNYFCKGPERGFTVTVSVPGEELKVLHTSMRVPLSENSIVTITPRLIETSDNLRNYEPNQHQCF